MIFTRVNDGLVHRVSAVATKRWELGTKNNWHMGAAQCGDFMNGFVQDDEHAPVTCVTCIGTRYPR